MLANQTGLSNKFVSERHHFASQTKFTAGEAAKLLRKKGLKISAKELVEAFRVLFNCDPEWHHAGFFKNQGKSTMGRTFFFSESQISVIESRFSELDQIKESLKIEKELKSQNIIVGFFFIWDHDYSGKF